MAATAPVAAPATAAATAPGAMAAAPADGKKKFVRKVAPSKSPRRLLRKELRSLERLINNKNKNALKDLPEEAIKANEQKIIEVKKQIEALGPETPSTKKGASKGASEDSMDIDIEDNNEGKGTKSLNKDDFRSREIRRAGRKVVSYKKQHPNYATTQEESKILEDLELDLLYAKLFPKSEEYITLFPESPLTDEQVKRQKEVKKQLQKRLESGGIKKPDGSKKAAGKKEAKSRNAESKPATEEEPASNWSDEEKEMEVEEDKPEVEQEIKKQQKPKAKGQEKPKPKEQEKRKAEQEDKPKASKKQKAQ